MRTDMRTRLRTDPLSGNYRDVALCRLLKAFEGLCRLLRLTGWLVTITNSLLHQHHLQPLLHPAASQSKYVHLLAPHTQPLGLRRVLHRPYGQSSACISWSLLKKFTPSLPPVVDCSLLREHKQHQDVRTYDLARFTCFHACLLYTSPSPRDRQKSRMPSSA